jgi:LCP family protein required for cell wall assembly
MRTSRFRAKRFHDRGIAAIASAVVPGAGQWFAGHRRRAIGFVAVTVLLAIGAVILVLQGKVFLAKQAFKPTVLISILLADVALLAFRGYASLDAWRLARSDPRRPRPSRGRAWLIVLGIVAAMIVVVPHAVVAYYDLVQYDLITSIFADDPVAAGTTTTTTTSAATTVADTSTTIPGATTSSTTSTSSTTTTTTTTLPPKIWDGLERLNLLLLGSDAGIGRTGVRTDTLMVASIDPATGDSALFSVPRNIARVPLPAGLDIWSCDCFPQIINELYLYGAEHPEAFPGTSTPGGNAIKAGIGELLGIPIHYYALVNLQSFVDIVDAIGGIEIVVPERVYDANYPHEDGSTQVIDIRPGEYQMDGHTALAYARSRHGSDDYNRMGRQRCVIEAVLEQTDAGDLLLGFPQLAATLKENLETDIPLAAVPDLIGLLALVDTEQVVSIRFIPPTYTASRTEAGYPVPNVDLIREHVGIVMDLPPAEAMQVLGIDPLDDACG